MASYQSLGQCRIITTGRITPWSNLNTWVVICNFHTTSYRHYWSIYNSTTFFCRIDASANLYNTALYFWVKLLQKIETYLIFSKSRLKSISKCDVHPLRYNIPRMELLAAVIGARAFHSITTSINIKISRTILWTDSQCLIHWYHSKKLLPKFVANRIKQIKNMLWMKFDIFQQLRILQIYLHNLISNPW